MKSVLISIRPKWVEKIANGQKTIEVRKTAPKELREFGRFDGTVPMKRPCAPWCYVKER